MAQMVRRSDFTVEVQTSISNLVLLDIFPCTFTFGFFYQITSLHYEPAFMTEAIYIRLYKDINGLILF